MSYADYIKSICRTGSSYASENNSGIYLGLSHGSTLNPAAREAREIIPPGIVTKNAALYGIQVSQAQVPQDRMERLTTIYQNIMNQSNSEKIQKNSTFSRSNTSKIAYRTNYADLPREIKEYIFGFLELKPLNALSKVSREIEEIIQSRFFQNKILCYFALENAVLIPSANLRYFTLVNIAKELAKSGSVEEARTAFILAKDAALLLKSNYNKCSALRNIAVAQAENDDAKGAKDTFTLINAVVLSIQENYEKRSTFLKEIATVQAKNSDREGAKITFALAKKVALSIENDDNKRIVLEKIAIKQAQSGDINGAKETSYLLDNRAEVLKEIIVEHVRNNDLIEAQNMALHIDDNASKFDALYAIARGLYKNGDTAKEKDIFDSLRTVNSLIKDTERKSTNLLCIAILQSESGDTDGAKETFTLAKTIALLIEDSSDKHFVLLQIATIQAKSNDVDGAKETFALAKTTALQVEDNVQKCILLQEIAIEQAKSGDMDGAKELFSLLQNIVLQIENNVKKSILLEKIAREQAEHDDIDGAKKTLNLLEDIVSLLEYNEHHTLFKALSITQAKIGNVERAKEILILLRNKTDRLLSVSIREQELRLNFLYNIAKSQIQIGDLTGAKETLLLMENDLILPTNNSSNSSTMSDFSSSSSDDSESDSSLSENAQYDFNQDEISRMTLLQWRQSDVLLNIVKEQTKKGNTIEAKNTIAEMKKKNYAYSDIVEAALSLVHTE